MPIYKKRKIPITTNIREELSEWLHENKLTLAEFIEYAYQQLHEHSDVLNMRKRLNFFATTTVDLQNNIKGLEKENKTLTLKLASLQRKIEGFSNKSKKNI